MSEAGYSDESFDDYSDEEFDAAPSKSAPIPVQESGYTTSKPGSPATAAGSRIQAAAGGVDHSSTYAPPSEWSAPPSRESKQGDSVTLPGVGVSSRPGSSSRSASSSGPTSARRHASTFAVSEGDQVDETRTLQQNGEKVSGAFSGLTGRALKRVQAMRSSGRLLAEAFAGDFSAPPLTPFDAYCRTLRTGAAQQTSSQTSGDAGTVGVQTEVLPWSTKGVQAPHDLGLPSSIQWHQAFVAGKFNPYMNASGGARLLPLLSRAALTMELLLEENVEEADEGGGRTHRSVSNYAYSSGTRIRGNDSSAVVVPLPHAGAVTSASKPGALAAAVLAQGASLPLGYVLGPSVLPSLMTGRAAVAVAVAPVSSTVAVAFSPSRHSPESLSSGPGQEAGRSATSASQGGAGGAELSMASLLRSSIVLVWSPDALAAAASEGVEGGALSQPACVLLCPGVVSSLEWSDDRGRVLVAGGRSGSVWLWDTQEPAGLHQHHIQGEMKPPLKSGSAPTPVAKRRGSPKAASKRSSGPAPPKPPPMCAFGIASGIRFPTYTTDALGMGGSNLAVGGGAGDLGVTGSGHHYGDVVKVALLGGGLPKSRGALWSEPLLGEQDRHYSTPLHNSTDSKPAVHSSVLSPGLADLLRASGVSVSGGGPLTPSPGTPGAPSASGAAGSSASSSSGGSGSSSSFQMASMDSRGVVNVWTGVEIPGATSVGGDGEQLLGGAGGVRAGGMRAAELSVAGWSPLNDSDAGVAAGGRVKLSRSCTVACVGGVSGLPGGGRNNQGFTQGVRAPVRVSGAASAAADARTGDAPTDDSASVLVAPAVPPADASGSGSLLATSVAAHSTSQGAAALEELMCPLPMEGPRVCALAARPGDGGAWVVGRMDGVLGHVNRWGAAVTPREWPPAPFCGGTPVTAVTYNPWDPRFVLAGYANGTLALFSSDHTEPVASWPECTASMQSGASAVLTGVGTRLATPLRSITSDGADAGVSPPVAVAAAWMWGSGSGSNVAPIIDVVWSRTRPCVFWVLDASPAVHAWDLSKSTRHALSSVQLPCPQGSLATGMSVGGSSEVQVTRPVLAVAFTSGEVWMARIGQHFAVPLQAEGKVWQGIMDAGML